MSQTVITTAFEQWKARQAETGEPVLLDEFIFANVPGLDPAKPVDRSEGIPPQAQIVHRQAVTRKGVVNQNAVVHSVVLGADTGDFTFNWIGLTNSATGTLAMIVHAPAQQKLKTREGQQGNVLTRSFLMEYSGAQQETGISTPAETWQIDFTARMGAMDERQRLENTDIYGPAAFFGDGWLVGKSGTQYYVTHGAGYLGGLRAQLDADQNIKVGVKPVKVWLDVCFTGTLASVWGVQSKITVAADLADYEQDGVTHYVTALASIDAAGNITDLRPKGSLDNQQASDALKKHEQSRNHPDATLKEKGFVQLSSATDSASETAAATPKAVKAANDNASSRLKASANLSDLADISKAREVLKIDKVGNWMAVQANGGQRSSGNHQIFIDWGADGKPHLTVDASYIGELFTTANPPKAAQTDAVPMSGGTLHEEASISVISAVKSGDAGQALYGPLFRSCMKGRGGDRDFKDGGSVAFRIVEVISNYAYAEILFDGYSSVQSFQFRNDGSFRAPGQLHAGGAFIATDGNLYGGVWGGYLNNWIQGQIAAQVNDVRNWVYQNFVNSSRQASPQWTGGVGGGWQVPAGCVVIGARNNGSSDVAHMGLLYAAQQILVNGNWVTIGLA
ncbi:phage tail protein [Pantoea agglomerans]|uniref:phage tail-collar fiber domain-containing protein n=1 Tax=Enterobacter agglomerans TaxID=549 RepID=UPI0010C21505|nr:phage tail protein [Pantoea agglomerans]TKJ56921.1 phage tail protein [Pantoea agglomerans]